MNSSILKIAGEEALQQNIVKTKDYVNARKRHTIVDSSGVEYASRSKLKFIGATVTDDSQNDLTQVSISGGGVTSFNGRSGSVLPIGGDYDATQINISSVRSTTVASAISSLESNTVGMSRGYVNVGAIMGIPTGMYSTIEGYENAARGWYAHASGRGNFANNDHQTVVGKYNDDSSLGTLFEVGNGTSSRDRSNAFEVFSDGHVNINGDIYQNGSLLPIGGGGVTSFNGRSGSIIPVTGDYTADLVTYSPNVTVKTKIDSIAGTWTTPVTCLTGDTSVTITNSAITTNSVIRIQSQTSSGKPLPWTSCVSTTGQVVITFAKALTETTDVILQIINL